MKKFKSLKVVMVVLLALSLIITTAGCGGGGDDQTQISRFENTPIALTELGNGGVDAVVADRPVVLAYLENNPQSGMEAFGDDKFELEYYGVAMRQDDTELHALVNEGLAKVMDDGRYEEIQTAFFGDGEYEIPESNNSLDKSFIVGMDAAYAPFEWVDEATGEIVGFDAALIQTIAAEMGFEVELRHVEWDGIIPALLASNVDMVISAMTITEERKESVAFSDPYFEATQFIVVKEGSDISNLDDLAGKRIGVQNGTTGDLFVSDYFEN